MLVGMCKKSVMPIENKEQMLVRFSEDTSKTIATTHVMTRLGDQNKNLELYVVVGRVHSKLGYPGPKSMKIVMDCGEDCLRVNDGGSLMC